MLGSDRRQPRVAWSSYPPPRGLAPREVGSVTCPFFTLQFSYLISWSLPPGLACRRVPARAERRPPSRYTDPQHSLLLTCSPPDPAPTHQTLRPRSASQPKVLLSSPAASWLSAPSEVTTRSGFLGSIWTDISQGGQSPWMVPSQPDKSPDMYPGTMPPGLPQPDSPVTSTPKTSTRPPALFSSPVHGFQELADTLRAKVVRCWLILNM